MREEREGREGREGGGEEGGRRKAGGGGKRRGLEGREGEGQSDCGGGRWWGWAWGLEPPGYTLWCVCTIRFFSIFAVS